MIKRKRAFSSLFLLVFIAFITLTSCKKENKFAAPPIPPSTSIMMDLGSFSLEKDGWVELSNWQYSVVTLAYWNSLLHTCAIPLTAFQKASEQEAIYLDQNKWGWNYSIDVDSLIINSKLEASIIEDSIQWKLFISLSLNKTVSEPFLWLEGKSAHNESGGWWLFYKSPVQPNQFLKIDWREENESSIRYTYVNKNDLEKGAFIILNKTNDPVFNASYTVYNKLINHYFYIDRNTDNSEGRIKSSFLFNDSNWHCWDSSKANTSCK
jgi:hypothetical protein